MSALWHSDDDPPPSRITGTGWFRMLARGCVLGLLIFGGLAVLLVVRMIERPIWRQNRPWTPYITQTVCRVAFVILGVGFLTKGQQMSQKGAVVANHSSCLDIFALNARKRVYFVAKSEVAAWPGIGWLARATGTVFIRRDPRDAIKQKSVFYARLLAGHKLLFFPEGTSTDGLRVLPFKSTLFAAFFEPELHHTMWIQPVSVVYYAPVGEEARFYGWWGDMEFAPHLLKTLAARRQGSVEVIYHPPLHVSDYADRKALARDLEKAVRSGLPIG
jgi:lyso-ornithine lipid O-acyltransferase